MILVSSRLRTGDGYPSITLRTPLSVLKVEIDEPWSGAGLEQRRWLGGKTCSAGSAGVNQDHWIIDSDSRHGAGYTRDSVCEHSGPCRRRPPRRVPLGYRAPADRTLG